ncbi:MAG: phosphohydrolase, partial [Tsuneonella sp.]
MLRAKGKPRLRIVLALLLPLAVAVAAKAWHDTTRDPLVRHLVASVPTIDGPRVPRRIVFLSDIHVGGPDMPPARLSRIVAQVNALR